VAATDACRAAGSATVGIRWPNDLVHDGRKLGGVLAELRSTDRPGSELVVGIGINVGLAEVDLPVELVGVATSLRIASARSMLDRERLAADFLLGLEEIARLLEQGNWECVSRRWLALSPESHGALVRVRSGRQGSAQTFDGRTAGIDQTGALLVRGEDGTIVAVRTPGSVVRLEDRSCC
jgi:BirA family biotin operon repressor/biotin-[acetyl-CoA-carboxylase] ligase